MSAKNASSFMSTIMSTCTLVEKLTGHTFNIFVSPTGIFVVILAILSDVSLSMSSSHSIASVSSHSIASV